MTISPDAASGRSLLTRRNLVLLAVALLTIAAGYVVLSQGTEAASLAAVLLVLGYVVLVPIALIL